MRRNYEEAWKDSQLSSTNVAHLFTAYRLQCNLYDPAIMLSIIAVIAHDLHELIFTQFLKYLLVFC